MKKRCRLRSAVQRVDHLLSRLRAEAGERGDLFERRVLHALQASKGMKQLAPPSLADARNLQKFRCDRSLGPADALERDRESMCFVTGLLEQAQCRRAALEHDRIGPARQKDLLFPLRQTDEGQAPEM